MSAGRRRTRIVTDNRLSDVSSRYWPKVRKAEGCWEWTGAKGRNGYGRMRYVRRGQLIYAHHVAMILDGRPRPDGAIALHSCNNPSCVNPRHLRWGTQKENVRQAINSGRAPHHGRVPGEKNGNAKLTEDQARAIAADTALQADIAKRYGISTSLVSAIKCGKAWGHLWRGLEL